MSGTKYNNYLLYNKFPRKESVVLRSVSIFLENSETYENIKNLFMVYYRFYYETDIVHKIYRPNFIGFSFFFSELFLFRMS